MAKVLGLYDWHNCSAGLVEDGHILAAIEEERLTRTKIEFGLPKQAARMVLDMTGNDWDDLDAIAVCGVTDPTPIVRWNQHRLRFEREMGRKWRTQYLLWRFYNTFRGIYPVRTAERVLNRAIMKRQVAHMCGRPELPIHLVDHHLCHASVGYRTSGFSEALVLTIDGSGDGHSTVLYLGKNGHLSFVAGSKDTASLGKLYSNATLGLGFSKLTGEGKIMGLAAYGNPQPYSLKVQHVLQITDIDSLKMTNSEDLIGNGWSLKIKDDLRHFRREDIAAAVQKHFEHLVLKIVRHFVNKTGLHDIVLVGGAAMNVKLNQRVREMDGVNSVYVFPAMTDAGVSCGAALEVCNDILKNTNSILEYNRLQNAYLGPEYSDDEIKAILDKRGYGDVAIWHDDIDKVTGELVAENAIVARFSGRMAYGPRALGNRSILALATRDEVDEILNQRLNRDEFMPFAPSILEEHAADYLENYVYSPFMVETFDVKPAYRDKFPAIIHVDGTLRPQIVRKSVNQGYWRVINTIGDLTGHYLVLNTSFNMHGEPIVCSPDDALDTFKKGPVDYLAIGHWLLKYDQKCPQPLS